MRGNGGGVEVRGGSLGRGGGGIVVAALDRVSDPGPPSPTPAPASPVLLYLPP